MDPDALNMPDRWPEAEDREKHYNKYAKELADEKTIIDDRIKVLNGRSQAFLDTKGVLKGDYYTAYTNGVSNWQGELTDFVSALTTISSSIGLCEQKALREAQIWASRVGVK